MTIVYLLFYDTDDGCREEWNTFYTPCEAFSSATARSDRMIDLRTRGYEFHTLDLEVSG